jgi:hypothetical protein
MDDLLKKTIKDLEVELLQPHVRKNISRLNELISDDFIEFGASGNRYNKKDVLNVLPGSDEVKYTIREFAVIEVTAGTMLATYRVEKEVPSCGEKTFSVRRSIWQERKGQWQIIFHQGAPEI